MKKIILSGLLLFSFFTVTAQNDPFKEDVNKLIKITVGTSDMAMLRKTFSQKMDANEKENFYKEYDAAVFSFLAEIEKYYMEHYTHDEIKQLLDFYNTPTGKKFLKDKRYVVENEFPSEFKLSTEIYQMKTKEKNTKKD